MIDGVIQPMAKKSAPKVGKAKPRSAKAAVQVHDPAQSVTTDVPPTAPVEVEAESVVTQVPAHTAPLVTTTRVAGAVRGNFQERLVSAGLIQKLGRVERLVSSTAGQVDMAAVREHSELLAKMVIEALADGHLQPFELLALGVAFAKAVRAAHKE